MWEVSKELSVWGKKARKLLGSADTMRIGLK